VGSEALRSGAESSAAVQELVAAADGVQEINGRLYRMLTMQAAHTAGLNAADELRAMLEATGRVDGLLQKWQDTRASAEQRPRVATLVAGVAKYKDALELVAQMVDLDFNASVSFLPPFDANFRDLTNAISALVQDVEQSGRAGTERAQASAAATARFFIGTTAAAGLLSLLATAAMTWTTVRSIRTIAEATSRLATGDTDTDLAGLARRDELGAIVRALVVFRDGILQMKALRTEQERQAQLAEQARRATLHGLAQSFEQTVGHIVHQVTEAAEGMQSTAQRLSRNASATSRQASGASDAARDAGSGITSAASGAEQLAGAIAEIASQVTKSAGITRNAVEQAQRTNTIVLALSEAAGKIGNVVQLISRIAGKTNLLALNATIEAARAGEDGRGFVVVANEVKALAQQTRKATTDIGAEVAHIQGATQEAVDAIRGIAETIDEVSRIAVAIAGSVQQQGAATDKITRNVQQASAATLVVVGSIGEVSEAVSGTETESARVLDAARSLTTQAEDLAAKVDTFVSGVRAA
jgi:methyl-accepting chemotaxis protein